MLLHNTLGKGGASPARCTPPEQGAFRPRAPHDEEPGPVPATSPNPARIGCAATACPVASTIEGALPPDTPSVRLFVPGNHVPLHRPSGPCPNLRVRLSRPTPRAGRGPCTPIHDRPIRRSTGGDVPAVIHLPDQSQPEPAADAKTAAGRHTGR